MEQQMELKQKAEKLREMKDNIQTTLKTYHKQVQERNMNEAMKQKAIRNEILELKRDQIDETLEKNKISRDIVREQEKSFLEKKKQEELEKKKLMKEELIKKMKEESELKNQMDNKINKFEQRENDLIERISQTKQGINSITGKN